MSKACGSLIVDTYPCRKSSFNVTQYAYNFTGSPRVHFNSFIFGQSYSTFYVMPGLKHCFLNGFAIFDISEQIFTQYVGSSVAVKRIFGAISLFCL